MKNLFIAPVCVTIVALAGIFWWGGDEAFFLAAALAVLEVTLSFDNAVVNAKVLEKMPPLWAKRFLTWGMPVSVVGVRLILPIFIISIVAGVSPFVIAAFAISSPLQYAELMESSTPAIEAFGGIFLLLLALRYFFDSSKEVHWLSAVERHFARWGSVEAVGIALALAVLLLVVSISPEPSTTLLKSGIVGALLFIVMEGLTSALGSGSKALARAGFGLFAYLNVLDAAFSLDGVMGAFALTTSVPIIVVGLGIGAYFVRTLTVVLVRGGTLRKIMYLEHGAHWAILALSLCMLASLVAPIPEWFTASVGLLLVAFAYLSSRREATAL